MRNTFLARRRSNLYQSYAQKGKRKKETDRATGSCLVRRNQQNSSQFCTMPNNDTTNNTLGPNLEEHNLQDTKLRTLHTTSIIVGFMVLLGVFYHAHRSFLLNACFRLHGTPAVVGREVALGLRQSISTHKQPRRNRLHLMKAVRHGIHRQKPSKTMGET